MNYVEKQKHLQEGFTLVEILIASALMIILGAVATYSYRAVIDSNSKKATIASLKTIRGVLENYNEDVGEYPAALTDLVKKPLDEKAAANWEGPYMETKKNETPKDAWKQPFVYNLTEGGEHPYELYSYGKNKKSAPRSEWIDAWKQ